MNEAKTLMHFTQTIKPKWSVKIVDQIQQKDDE